MFLYNSGIVTARKQQTEAAYKIMAPCGTRAQRRVGIGCSHFSRVHSGLQ